MPLPLLFFCHYSYLFPRFAEIVLSALACDGAIIDGVDGAMVVTAETAGAGAIVFPSGCVVELDVGNGALRGAPPAMDAHVAVDGELLVGNHAAVEVSANDVAERPGREA